MLYDIESIERPRIDIPMEGIKSFCRRWMVKEFSLFGSVLTDDFRPNSDVDVLVVFESDVRWSLWDIVDMREELKLMFGREIDIVEKRALRNPFRKHHILKNSKALYAS